MAIPILVVDADDEYRKLMTDTLEGTGQFTTFPAGSAGEAITILTKQTVQIAVVDIDLPDLDGPEFLKELREIDRHLLIIAIVDDEAEQAPLFKDAKVATTIEKPFFLPELPSIIQNAIRPSKPKALDQSKRNGRPVEPAPKASPPSTSDAGVPHGMTDFLKSFSGDKEIQAGSADELLAPDQDDLEEIISEPSAPIIDSHQTDSSTDGQEFPTIFSDLDGELAEPPDPLASVTEESEIAEASVGDDSAEEFGSTEGSQFTETFADPAGEIPQMPRVPEISETEQSLPEKSEGAIEEQPLPVPIDHEIDVMDLTVDEPMIEPAPALPSVDEPAVALEKDSDEIDQIIEPDEAKAEGEPAQAWPPHLDSPEMEFEAAEVEVEGKDKEDFEGEGEGDFDREEIPPWLDDNFIAGEYLTALFSEHSARGLLLLRDRNLWAWSQQFSEDQARTVTDIFLEHKTSSEPMEAIVRYITIDPQEGDVLLYAVPVLARIILVLIYDADKSFGLARRQANAVSERLARVEPSEAHSESPTPPQEEVEEFESPLYEEPMGVLPQDWIPVAPASEVGHPMLSEIEVPPPDPEPIVEEILEADVPQLPSDWLPKQPTPTGHLPFLDEGTTPQSVQESKTEIDPSQPQATMELPFTAIFLPRFPQHHLEEGVGELIAGWVRDLCIAWGWRLEAVETQPELLRVTLQLSPDIAPNHAFRQLAKDLSQRLLENKPELTTDLPSGQFWVKKFFITAGSDPTRAQIDAFIETTRQEQGFNL